MDLMQIIILFCPAKESQKKFRRATATRLGQDDKNQQKFLSYHADQTEGLIWESDGCLNNFLHVIWIEILAVIQ